MADKQNRPLTIITGANGGMGRACARRLGATSDLLLTDATPKLEQFCDELQAEGFTIRECITGGLGDDTVLERLVSVVEHSQGFDTLIHTAGLGPASPWRDIMEINYVATVRLLNRLEPFLRPGSVAVLIASVAGHLMNFSKDIETVIAEPLSETLCEDLEPLLECMVEPSNSNHNPMGLLSYCLSKKRVVDMCMERAAAWGARQARIISISPGMIYTPMGRNEASTDPLADKMVTASPLGRWGTATEIAMTAEFLASPAASFITGSDVKVDGGGYSNSQMALKEAWFNNLEDRG